MLTGTGYNERAYNDSLQGQLTGTAYRESDRAYNDSLQRQLTGTAYNDSLQGQLTGTAYRESLQGELTGRAYSNETRELTVRAYNQYVVSSHCKLGGAYNQKLGKH